MLKIHESLEDIKIDDYKKWDIYCINTLMHMIHLFKIDNIDSIKFDTIDAYGRISKIKCYKGYVKNYKKRERFWYCYRFIVDKELIERVYSDDLDNYILNSIEFSMLHELAHIKYMNHKKRFHLEMSRLVYNWVKYKTGMKISYIKSEYPEIRNWLKREKRYYKRKD